MNLISKLNKRISDFNKDIKKMKKNDNNNRNNLYGYVLTLHKENDVLKEENSLLKLCLEKNNIDLYKEVYGKNTNQ